jgi:hypothetical protein
VSTAPATPPAGPTRAGRWANIRAATLAALRGWPPCAAGCGWPLDPAGDDGTGTHPGCDTRPALTLIRGGIR